jgi:hypothetical protein
VHNEEPHNLYYSLNIRMKLRAMRWEGMHHVWESWKMLSKF